MTFTATYVPAVSGVHLAASSAPAGADYAYFQRSTDNVTWTDVRGGQTVSLVGGAAAIDDYDGFTPNVVNYYRVSYVDTGIPTMGNVGAIATGNNTAVVPPLPASPVAGDLLMIFYSIRVLTGSVVVPAGWELVAVNGNQGVLARYWQPGDVAPSVAFTGGVANADTMARMAIVKNCQKFPYLLTSVTNGSQQNIPFPAFQVSQPNSLIVLFSWKQDDWTPPVSPAGTFENVTTTGDDAGQVVYALPYPDPIFNVAGFITVTGGAAAQSRSMVAGWVHADYLQRDTANVTPSFASDEVWLKNVLRPNLNRRVYPVEPITVSEDSRTGLFNIMGKTYPTAVTELRGSQEFTLILDVPNYAARDEIRNTLATGEVMYLQVPPGKPVNSMHVNIGNTKYDDQRSLYTLPMTQIASPDPTVVGSTVLWVDIVATFATWADLIAAEPTWSDVVSRIADGSQVIVP